MKLPLEGIKILDLTRLLPGAYCTLLLADLGAEVIKIENPQEGDHMRWIEPLLHGTSIYFLALNRNKKSMKLNLKSPEGIEIFRELVKGAAVVFESFRPGVVDRLGIGYKDLKKINPGIIFCSLSGYGQEGPYRLKPGHDLNYISVGGVQGINGTRGGTLFPPGVQIADIGCGASICAISILSALLGREKTGEGQYLDVAMLDGVVSWMSMAIAGYSMNGQIPQPGKLPFSGEFPSYNIYETKDQKYISLGCVEKKFWDNFCQTIGRTDLCEKFQPPDDKQDEVIGEVSRIFLEKTQEEWDKLLNGIETCFAPVNTISDTMADPQVKHRELLKEVEHPKGGKMIQVGFPARFSNGTFPLRENPPEFGEHTTEILIDLGYGSKVQGLKAKGVI